MCSINKKYVQSARLANYARKCFHTLLFTPLLSHSQTPKFIEMFLCIMPSLFAQLRIIREHFYQFIAHTHIAIVMHVKHI